MIGLTAGELAQQAAELLIDTCTLESPDRNQASGWASQATGVACRLVDSPGQGAGGKSTGVAGGLANLVAPYVSFLRTQTLATDWRITVTNKGNRKLKIDTIVEPHAGAFQHAVGSGTR